MGLNESGCFQLDSLRLKDFTELLSGQETTNVALNVSRPKEGVLINLCLDDVFHVDSTMADSTLGQKLTNDGLKDDSPSVPELFEPRLVLLLGQETTSMSLNESGCIFTSLKAIESTSKSTGYLFDIFLIMELVQLLDSGVRRASRGYNVDTDDLPEHLENDFVVAANYLLRVNVWKLV